MNIEQFINYIDSRGELFDILYTQARSESDDVILAPTDNILEAHPRFAAIWRDIMESYAALYHSIDEYYDYVESCQHETERK